MLAQRMGLIKHTRKMDVNRNNDVSIVHVAQMVWIMLMAHGEGICPNYVVHDHIIKLKSSSVVQQDKEKK